MQCLHLRAYVADIMWTSNRSNSRRRMFERCGPRKRAAAIRSGGGGGRVKLLQLVVDVKSRGKKRNNGFKGVQPGDGNKVEGRGVYKFIFSHAPAPPPPLATIHTARRTALVRVVVRIENPASSRSPQTACIPARCAYVRT